MTNIVAPTYLVNAVALLFLASQFLGFDIPYTSEQVQSAFTILVVLGTPIFTMARQLVTGRATVLGGRGPAAE